jgi:hypothetical protein
MAGQTLIGVGDRVIRARMLSGTLSAASCVRRSALPMDRRGGAGARKREPEISRTKKPVLRFSLLTVEPVACGGEKHLSFAMRLAVRPMPN